MTMTRYEFTIEDGDSESVTDSLLLLVSAVIDRQLPDGAVSEDWEIAMASLAGKINRHVRDNREEDALRLRVIDGGGG